MMTLGKAPELSNNFSKITMKETLPQTSNPSDTLIDQLNNKKSPVKYVERKEHNKLGKDEFLKLLTFQLGNQDPLDPMDQKKFAADLAQFTQLEQLTNIRQSLEKMGTNKVAESKFYAASFLGKEVLTKGTTFQYAEGMKSLIFNLSQNAENVVINIFDQKNNLVSKMELGPMAKGSHQADWTGKTLDGGSAAKGDYRLEVLAYDQNLRPFAGDTQTGGIVTGVNFADGEAILEVNGHSKVYLHDVESFRLPEIPTKTKVLEAYQKNSGVPGQ